MRRSHNLTVPHERGNRETRPMVLASLLLWVRGTPPTSTWRINKELKLNKQLAGLGELVARGRDSCWPREQMNPMTHNIHLHPCTLCLISAGVISLASVLRAEEVQPHPVLTAISATSLSGFVDASINWMPGKGNRLFGRSFDQGSNSAPGQNKQDGFNLNLVSLTLENPLDEGKWSAGYRVQMLMGPDANALASSSSFNPVGDFAIKEANVALRAPIGNGLDFRLGVWTELLGYEVTESFLNPNYSRSWGFFIEPIIHTGLLTSYKFNDCISALFGIVDNGVASNAINSRSVTESEKSYTGLLTLTAPESFGFLGGSVLYLSILDSGTSGRMDPVNYYAGITMPTPIKGLSVGIADDYRANGQFDHSYENAADFYLLYQASEKLKFASRTEYATGSAGAWGVIPSPEEQNVKLFGQTLTADYSLWKNIVTRGEVRWDHSLTGQRMFGDGNQRNAISLTLDVVYRF